jgi:hypothetical protein
LDIYEYQEHVKTTIKFRVCSNINLQPYNKNVWILQN